MKSSTAFARSPADDALSALDAASTVTLFDRAEPACCLIVRVERHGATLRALAPPSARLVDRMRCGAELAWFAEVGGRVVEGAAEGQLGGSTAAGVELELVPRPASTAAEEAGPRSIPRT